MLRVGGFGTNTAVLPVLNFNNVSGYLYRDGIQDWFYFSNKVEVITGICNTENVTNCYCTFYRCNNLKYANLNGMDTSNVTNMRFMFGGGCQNLAYVSGLENFNTSNVTGMDSMFYYAGYGYGIGSGVSTSRSPNGLTWDVSKVTSFHNMFSLSRFPNIYINFIRLSTINSNVWNMFSSARINSVNLQAFNFRGINSTYRMFADSNINVINMENADFSDVTNTSDMFMGAKCGQEEKQPLIGKIQNTENIVNGQGMFDRSSYLWAICMRDANLCNLKYANNMFRSMSSNVYQELRITNLSSLEQAWQMFFNTCVGINMNALNFSNLVNASDMFHNCKMNLAGTSYYYIVRDANWCNLVNARNMFRNFSVRNASGDLVYGMQFLSELNLSNLKDASNMFADAPLGGRYGTQHN